MIRRAHEVQTSRVEGMKGGKGALLSTHLLGEKEFYGKGRMFNLNVLKPGCSVGVHTHEGDFEVYCILKGQGTYTDNGASFPIGAGDVTICHEGESHGIENTGTEDLEFIALILFTK